MFIFKEFVPIFYFCICDDKKAILYLFTYSISKVLKTPIRFWI